MNDALAVIDPDEPEAAGPQSLTLFGTADPLLVVAKASRVALALATVINTQELYTVISTKKYVHVEGWTLLGSMLGVTAQIEWTRKLENGWEARAIAVYNGTGATVGAGEAQCLYTESKWKSRDDFALRGMAQTRAISRALRGPLGFVVQLAGFATTPADEMPTADEQFHAKETARRAGTAPPLSPTPANPTHMSPSPAPKSPADTWARVKPTHSAPTDDEMVCAGCGSKAALRPLNNPRFCAKAEGGCGLPPRGDVLKLISYAAWQKRQSK
jgi:hypothetical protein